jgi:hypothetical protein
VPNRDIRESCRTSETLAKLTHGCERLFWRLTTYADDWGRFLASAAVLRAHCFALLLTTISELDVEGWIAELQHHNLIRLYTAEDGKLYGEFVTWRKHQRVRAKFSKYPAPTPAGIRRQMTTHVPVVTEDPVVPEVPVVTGEPERTETPALTTSAPAGAGAGRRVKASKGSGNGSDAPTAATWAAYSMAYRKRYGVEPVRNAKVNGQLANFITRISVEEAPAVAAHYVDSNAKLYVAAGHPVDLLLRDAEKLRTEWATDRRVTEAGARELDQRQESSGVWNRMLQKAEAPDGPR